MVCRWRGWRIPAVLVDSMLVTEFVSTAVTQEGAGKQQSTALVSDVERGATDVAPLVPSVQSVDECRCALEGGESAVVGQSHSEVCAYLYC